MIEVVQSLAPIVLLIALGAALLRFGFFDNSVRQGLDRFVYWVALPSLFIAELSRAQIDGGEAGRIAGILVAATLSALVVAYLVCAAMRLPRASTGAFVQAAFRGNLMFVGLPVVLFSMPGADAGHIRSVAVLAAAPIMLLYNVLAVTVLLVAQHAVGWRTLPRLVKPLVTNPLILACITGVILSYLPGILPRWLHRSLDLVGDTAPALALISMGAGLVVLRIGGSIGPAVASALVKVAVAPAVAAVLVWWMGLTGAEAAVTLIFSATPTAVASYVLATQLGGDQKLAAAAVLASTVLSLGSLGVILYVT